MTPDRRASRIGVGFGRRVVALWTVVGAFACPTVAWAQCTPSIGRIVNVSREVTMSVARGANATPATINAPICIGGLIRTGDRSKATISLNNSTQLVIDQNTEWEVVSPVPPNSQIRVVRGAILVITRQRGLRVETPFVNAGVEGTEFLVTVEADRAYITVFEGEVQAFSIVQPNLQPLSVRSGQTAVAQQGQNPRILDVAPPDAVRWRLYYQPIIQPLLIAQLAPGGAPPTLETLTALPAASRDGRSYAQEAALRLDAGDVDGAETAVKAALARDATLPDAYAIRIVSAVVRNDRNAALETGRSAVKGPPSIPVRLAYSYALQANSDLDGARGVLTEIPDNDRTAAVWVRLSELALAMGEVSEAKVAAGRANQLETDGVETLVARGFVALAETDLDLAHRLFEDALRRGPGYAQSHLGLGLTKIRSGDLDGGRSDLEVAAGLNPGDAVIRSYLGKAYFDERRETQSGRQFEVAARHDPNDPTPLFYSAIQKQSTNRPVEALADLQKAIELNDARGVYRSRILLDEDLAARSAALGYVYRDLGFERLALVEAWRSVEADPGEHAGHRFLADLYSTFPRHEVARVSELLQAQLLQSVNLTPVSPRLAETDLFILEGAGPDSLSLNEFNPLFNRNRVGVQVSGALGNESITGDEVTVSGVWNRLSFSAGQFHYDTTGLRENNSQDRNLYNLFVQAQLSNATSLQGEVRVEEHRAGDLLIRFDSTDFIPDQQTRTDGTTIRLGVRHAFGPRSQVIGSLYARTQDVRFKESSTAFNTTQITQYAQTSDGYTGEVRHLLHLGRFRLTSGAGRFGSDFQRDIASEILRPNRAPIRTNIQRSDDPNQTNFYSYSTIDVAEALTVTAGVSADWYDQRSFERHQVNPKLGVTWRPTKSTTVRAAAFRTLHRAVVSNQTLEPTHVAGFSQLFADIEGTESRRYGVAIDQEFSRSVFAGVEYAARDLRVPYEVAAFPSNELTVLRPKRTEQFGRVYAYWTPLPSISTSAGYVFERFGGDPRASILEEFASVKAHRVPLELRYFAPAGLAARLSADYVRQRGLFSTGREEDKFWVLNAGVSYRVPQRYGRIALEIRNLLDEKLNFQDADPTNPTIRRGRLAVLKFTMGI